MMNTPITFNSHAIDLEQSKVQEIANSINIAESALSISYGSKPMQEIAKFSDTLLSQVKAKDAGDVGQQLTDLLVKVKEFDPANLADQSSSLLGNLPILGRVFKKIERSRINHTNITEQVEVITSHLDSSMIGIVRTIETLEQLYLRNFEFYKEVLIYIEAGKLKVTEAKTQDLVSLQSQAEKSGDLMDAQKVKDFAEKINRFERRIHDLELSKQISLQTAPQIRLIQNNSQTLAEKIQSSILSTLPIWKSQVVLTLSLDAQSKAVLLQKEVSDTTNSLLKKNAEVLQQNSIDVARESERSIIDIETLREVQNRLINTIEETMKIAIEAKDKRLSVEKELETMESDFIARINTATKQKNEAVRPFVQE